MELECDGETGKVLDTEREKIPFENDAVLKFEGVGENPDWKDLKVGHHPVGHS